MSKEFFDALTLLGAENNIEPEELAVKIAEGIGKAIKKDYPGVAEENIVVNINVEKGKFEAKLNKTVVEEVEDPENEISLEDALEISKRAKVGGQVSIKLNPTKFGRVAAQSAKQSIKHDIKEIERQRLLEAYEGKEHECVSATVLKVEPATKNAVLSIDKNEAYLVRSEQIPGEVLHEGDIIKVYVVGIVNPDRRPSVKISRTHRDLVKRLFELEVPEIYDGIVEVKSISREAGSRSKIAVYSKDENVDAVGACIGSRRSRIQAIVKELKGEKIDIIPYSEDDAEFVAAALAPAQVLSVTLAEDGSRSCSVVVPDNQLSLAIGNKGQNAKLAARLTGYKIDIGPEHTIEID
ncbi:MAG: transcription termination factor NusA [Ruminococcus sp.]|nr:transcription termination factor NusA [Ruminococcus sp.]